MSKLTIQHVKASELPAQWAERLNVSPDQLVTVSVETESNGQSIPTSSVDSFVTDDPAHGIWRDREDIPDVETYARDLRAPRYNLG